MGGAYGLDYSVIKDILEYLGITEDKEIIFQDIRVMEAEALTCMAEGKDKK